MGSIVDPICPACSKPIGSGSLVVFEHGELFHVRCRSRDLALDATEGRQRARDATARAAEQLRRAQELVEQLRRGRDPRADRERR